MLILQASILILLAGMFYQDLKYRGIYWWMFPALLILLGCHSSQILGFSVMLSQVLKSCLFLGLQFLVLTLYISLKQGRLTNIFNGFFGIGDLLFLVTVTFGFSFFNYVLFYLLSLLVIIILTAVIGADSKAHGKKIPLAGYQAGIMLLLILGSWYWPILNLLSDENVLNLLGYGS